MPCPDPERLIIFLLANPQKHQAIAEAGWLSKHPATGSIEILRYRNGLLHTKAVLVDREVALFGSVNLDMRSLWLNFEVSLVVYDRAFTGALRSLQQRYIDGSEMLDAAEWNARPAGRRMAENAARLVGPLL